MTKIIGLTGGIGSGKLRLQIIFNLWESCLYSGRRSTKNYANADVIDAIKETFGTTFEGAVLKETNWLK
jgi:dephospho-CoA kinase